MAGKWGLMAVWWAALDKDKGRADLRIFASACRTNFGVAIAFSGQEKTDMKKRKLTGHGYPTLLGRF